ncbi:MAG: DUF2520 domain-containing protein [Eubacterium sp.]|nr:DUF2520 domain-containing protein [Eubacterium sp.]
MRIGFIGAGKVGFTFGKYLKEKGLDIGGYYNRTPESAKEAAAFTDTLVYETKEELIDSCDIVMLTVSDSAISTVWQDIKNYSGLTGKIVCHTSGSISSKIFLDTPYQIYGYSIHPIYAISDRYKSYKTLSNAFITIEGHEKYLKSILGIFSDAGLTCASISGQHKTNYHAACVMASNLVCGLYNTACQLMQTCGMTPEESQNALKGLFRDNAIGISDNGPVAQLTGPIERGDALTVEAHMGEIDKIYGFENVSQIYRLLSKETLKLATIKNPDRDYSNIKDILEK